MLDIDGVILDPMAGFERHLQAAATQLQLPPAHLSLSRGSTTWRTPQLCQSPGGGSGLVASAPPRRHAPIYRRLLHPRTPAPLSTGEGSMETIHWFRRQQIPVAFLHLPLPAEHTSARRFLAVRAGRGRACQGGAAQHLTQCDSPLNQPVPNGHLVIPRNGYCRLFRYQREGCRGAPSLDGPGNSEVTLNHYAGSATWPF